MGRRWLMTGVCFSALSAHRSWGDCHKRVYGPKKTICNRFRRGPVRGVWERFFPDLAGLDGLLSELLVDSSCIKIHRTAGGVRGGRWL